MILYQVVSKGYVIWNISIGKSRQSTIDEITRALSIMKEKNPDMKIDYVPENEIIK